MKYEAVLWMFSCLPKYAAPCPRTQLLSLWSAKYFSNFDGKYFPILWLSECCVPTPYSIIVTVTGKRGRGVKIVALWGSVSRFSDCQCVPRWWWEIDIWWTGPEMSLTAFTTCWCCYLSSDWHHWMIISYDSKLDSNLPRIYSLTVFASTDMESVSVSFWEEHHPLSYKKAHHIVTHTYHSTSEGVSIQNHL